MRYVLFALLAGATPGLAQERPPAAPPAPVRRPWLVDAVVATVNDSAILLSELRTVAAGRIRTLRNEGNRLSQSDEKAILQRELTSLIDKRQMALSVKSLGVYTPDQIESLLRSELDREKQEKVRDLGSVLELSRALKEEGRTWPTYEREQRIDKLSDFADEFAVTRRLNRNTNLFLTPSMLRETYRREVAMFVHPARARLSIVAFRGPQAQAEAERAAASWSLQPLPSRELAGRFPGATPLPDWDASALASDLKPLTDFALAGPTGAVSPPIACRDATYVVRVVEHRPAADGRFEDPEVQARLRNLCQQRVIAEFRLQAMDRAKLRTEVWTSAVAGR